jgi:hypothetical protein
MIQAGAKGLLDSFCTFYNLLSFAYPDYPWNRNRLSRKIKKSSERLPHIILLSEPTSALLHQIQELLSLTVPKEIFNNYKHSALKWGKPISRLGH